MKAPSAGAEQPVFGLALASVPPFNVRIHWPIRRNSSELFSFSRQTIFLIISRLLVSHGCRLSLLTFILVGRLILFQND